MAYRFRRKALSLLLSALVLTWGILPLGIQHAHEGGSDATHRHDSGHAVAHHGLHDHRSDDEHHEHATLPDVSLLSDCVLHLHGRFFGIAFSMPLPENPVEGDTDEGTVPPPVIRVMNEVVPVPHAGPSFVRVLQAAICTPGADVVWCLEPIPQQLDPITSILLCDSARLERSGVLLA